MGAGAGKKFGEYLAEMGLMDKKESKLTAKKAIAKAEEILRLAREKDKK